MYLVAYVKDPYTGQVTTMEDSDYASKTDYARDLRANELTVLSISDNRDLYVCDHSDYGNISQLKKDMKRYKEYGKYWEDKYNELKELYDIAMKQPLDRKLD